MKRFLSVLVVCSAAFAQSLPAYTINGSRTMYALNVALTTKYRSSHPDMSFNVLDAGTTKGIEKVADGSADAAAVTRRLLPAELELMRKRAHGDGVFVPVAHEGISIYLHPQNHVEALSIDQIAAIYAGRITNWKQVGGGNLPIHLYAFDAGTGRHWYIIDEVMKKAKLAPGITYTTANPPGAKTDADALAAKEAQLLKWISSDPSAIGFGGLKKIRIVKLAKVYNGSQAYWPTPDNIMSGRYPLQRTLGYLLRNAPNGELKDFFDWSVQESEIIRSFGFVPVK